MNNITKLKLFNDSTYIIGKNYDQDILDINNKLSNALMYRGIFTGDIDSIDIDPGIYTIQSYSTVENAPSISSWTVFIQYPGPYKVQSLIGCQTAAPYTLPPVSRKYTGSNPTWQSWGCGYQQLEVVQLSRSDVSIAPNNTVTTHITSETSAEYRRVAIVRAWVTSRDAFVYNAFFDTTTSIQINIRNISDNQLSNISCYASILLERISY